MGMVRIFGILLAFLMSACNQDDVVAPVSRNKSDSSSTSAYKVTGFNARTGSFLFTLSDGSIWVTGFLQEALGKIGQVLHPAKIVIDLGNTSGLSAIASNDFGNIAILKNDGTVWLRGDNAYEYLGSPVDSLSLGSYVKAFESIRGLSSPNFGCMIKSDKSLWCNEGILKRSFTNDATLESFARFQLFSNDVSSVTFGNSVFFTKTDGTLWGFGQSVWDGEGGLRRVTTPEKILDSVTYVSSSENEAVLAIKSDGSLWGFGRNDQGQLGDGTISNNRSPFFIDKNITMAVAGVYHSLFLKKDGTLWAVGNNFYGQLGDGTFENRIRPVKVMANVKDVSAGPCSSLILKKDGSVWAMGQNDQGQLGIGTNNNTPTPTKLVFK